MPEFESRTAQLRRERSSMGDRPMLFSGTNYKRPSMLCRSVRQALVMRARDRPAPRAVAIL